jgi:hypothetical protein
LQEIVFDLLDLPTLYILVNYVLTGVGAALGFIIFYHITLKNDTFSKRDMFFFLAGPSAGFVLAVLGAPQIDVIQWTFTINLGLTGAKDGLLKIFQYADSKGTPKLSDASLEEIEKEVAGRK